MRHNELVVEKYNKWINENSDATIMGYGSESSQDVRFNILFKIGDMSGSTILDIGCGRGDFARKAIDKGIKFRNYLGVDIVPKMIEIAKKMNSFENAEFEVMDVLKSEKELSYDYVIMCGTLNLKTPYTLKIAKKLIKKAFEIARIGVGFNMTSVLGDIDCRTEHTYYFDPAEILRYCGAMTRNIAYDHTYMPHDFTVFMYKKGRYG